MAMRLYPNTLFGRNRNEKEVWYGYVSADVGAVTDPTKATLTEVDTTPNIVYDSVNKEIDLPANGLYRISVRLSQTGAGSYFEIYNVTGSAQLAVSLVAAGEKTVTHVVKTTTAISIAIRVDDQTANTITQPEGQVVVERIAKVFA